MGWGDSEQIALEQNPQYIKLMKAFRLFDKNGDGFIDAGELRDLLMRVNPDADPTKDSSFTEEDAAAIISAFDDNGDGKLSIEELVAAWSTIGGSDASLDAAMKERRASKQAQVEKKKRESAMAGDAMAGGEYANSIKKPEMAASKSAKFVGKPASTPAEPEAVEAAVGVSEAPAEPEAKSMTAAERARAKVVAKTGKDVAAGAGTKAGRQAQDAQAEANMTPAERAKAKAKEEIAKKEARKKALKEQKAKEAAEAKVDA